jgi:hypothetical protein
MTDNIIPFPTRQLPTAERAPEIRGSAKRVVEDAVTGTTATAGSLVATRESIYAVGASEGKGTRVNVPSGAH